MPDTHAHGHGHEHDDDDHDRGLAFDLTHFEIYPSLAKATAGNKIATSQLALPQDACSRVYATAGYEASARNFNGTSLARDMVFRDGGGVSQLATISGSPAPATPQRCPFPSS